MDQHLKFCFCFCFAVPGIKPRVSDIQGKSLLSYILTPTFYFSRNELMCIYNFFVCWNWHRWDPTGHLCWARFSARFSLLHLSPSNPPLPQPRHLPFPRRMSVYKQIPPQKRRQRTPPSNHPSWLSFSSFSLPSGGTMPLGRPLPLLR